MELYIRNICKIQIRKFWAKIEHVRSFQCKKAFFGFFQNYMSNPKFLQHTVQPSGDFQIPLDLPFLFSKTKSGFCMNTQISNFLDQFCSLEKYWNHSPSQWDLEPMKSTFFTEMLTSIASIFLFSKSTVTFSCLLKALSISSNRKYQILGQKVYNIMNDYFIWHLKIF